VGADYFEERGQKEKKQKTLKLQQNREEKTVSSSTEWKTCDPQ
jgi:hypothetical protein